VPRRWKRQGRRRICEIAKKKYKNIHTSAKKMRDTGWQHLGREDQDFNYKLATGDHPDLGLEGLVFEGGEEGLLKVLLLH